MSELAFIPGRIGRIDPTFESIRFLKTAVPELGRGGLRIWVAVTDTGAANAMSPALRILNAENQFMVMAREAGAETISKSGINFDTAPSSHPSRRLEMLIGDVVLTGMASNPTLELLTHKAANEKEIPIAAIEDYPGAYGSELKASFNNPQLRPSRLMVMNEWAKKANLADLPWLNPDHVLITGQPAFDPIAAENRPAIKSDVYSRAGIQDSDKLVVWMGQKGGTREAFEMFIDGLTQVKGDFRLAIRRHPRDVVTMGEYEQLSGPLRSRLVKTEGLPTSEVGAAADYLATIFSTEGLSSIMRGIPTLHILAPEILARTEIPGVVVPVVDASHVIADASQSRSVIANLFNERANQDLQEKMNLWRPDGRASERVAAALVDIAKGLL